MSIKPTRRYGCKVAKVKTNKSFWETMPLTTVSAPFLLSPPPPGTPQEWWACRPVASLLRSKESYRAPCLSRTPCRLPSHTLLMHLLLDRIRWNHQRATESSTQVTNCSPSANTQAHAGSIRQVRVGVTTLRQLLPNRQVTLHRRRRNGLETDALINNQDRRPLKQLLSFQSFQRKKTNKKIFYADLGGTKRKQKVFRLLLSKGYFFFCVLSLAGCKSKVIGLRWI